MRVFLAGHNGMVGGAILCRLATNPRLTLITAERATLDLRNQQQTLSFLDETRPDFVIVAAAKVGGIAANAAAPARFIFDNLMISVNLINGSHQAGVQHLIQLGSSCIYPRNAPQPIPENALLDGKLEPTNEPYAVAKIAAIKLCESYNREYGRDYRSLMPTNLYGPGDNYHPENSHVLPALLKRFHDAAQNKEATVTIWGTGKPRREFLYVDDMASAVEFLMTLPQPTYSTATKPMQSHLNVGTGKDISIIDLARKIATVTGFKGDIRTDPQRPDGTPRKCLDVRALTRLGWSATTTLDMGLKMTYQEMFRNLESGATLRAS